MQEFTKIITHPGPAHRDEFTACCILLAQNSEAAIERRDLTEVDLANPATVVLDQGGRHQPSLNNYDHHQLPRDAVPTCALSLVLQAMGKYEIARKVWPWLEGTEVLDSKGPMVLAKMVGMSWDAIRPLLSPVEDGVLRLFGKCVEVHPELDDRDFGNETPDYHRSVTLCHLMVEMGRSWLSYLDRYAQRLDDLERYAVLSLVHGVPVVDATFVAGNDDPVLALEDHCRALEAVSTGTRGKVAVTVTRDDRGQGLCLFRRNDDPRVDFSRLEGHEGVVFAHKGGFVAKTKEWMDPAALIHLALKD